MSDGLSALKEEDIQKLVRLIESLDSSTFDYLQLKVGDVQVTLGKGAMPMGAQAPAVQALAAPAYERAVAVPAVAALEAPSPAHMPPPGDAPSRAYASSPPGDAPSTAYTPPRSAPAAVAGHSAPLAKRPAPGPAPAGTVDIKAQIMGMYYAQPEPGSPAFVSVGAEVKEETTLCLIEVMKTFNAMTAGVKGVVTEICAENAQLVEYGQVLFRVRPL